MADTATTTTLSDIDTDLLTTGKPVEGGCAYACFDMDADAPADATTKMSSLDGWLSLGEVSDQGFTEGKSVTSNDFKGWHGSVVLSEVSDETNTIKVELIEVNRPASAKLRYGSANVDTGDDGSVSHVSGKSGSVAPVKLVFDELESNGHLRRTVVHKAKVNSFDDVAHQRGSLMLYGMTFTVLDPGEGNMFDIYRAKPATA